MCNHFPWIFVGIISMTHPPPALLQPRHLHLALIARHTELALALILCLTPVTSQCSR